jgi:hypothetical protein
MIISRPVHTLVIIPGAVVMGAAGSFIQVPAGATGAATDGTVSLAGVVMAVPGAAAELVPVCAHAASAAAAAMDIVMAKNRGPWRRAAISAESLVNVIISPYREPCAARTAHCEIGVAPGRPSRPNAAILMLVLAGKIE